MAKRTWNEMHSAEPVSGTALEAARRRSNGGIQDAVDSMESGQKTSPGDAGEHAANGSLPASRKIKACAACRKQKIKCLMDESGPPCRRCSKKNLVCVVNKSFQSMLDETIPLRDALLQDLETMHANVQTLLNTLNLPSMPSLQSSKFTDSQHTPNSLEAADHTAFGTNGPSCDNSPGLSPQDERDLPDVPIRSVYHLTKLSALRDPDATDEESRPGPANQSTDIVDDFVSRGLLSLEDAERLFRSYIERLDHYMYGVVNSRYSHLIDIRRRSPILAAAVLTVAAMHDPDSNSLYTICNAEFRRIVAASLFERRVDRDHLRALCVASYWLNDTSWILSGVATRRAAEFDVVGHYERLSTQNDEDSADFLRVWYLIYICDQHLSTLYGRQCSSREDMAIVGYDALLRLPNVTTGDQRLISQVALLQIIHEIRELFGPGTAASSPSVFSTQVKGFARQLDQWVARWSSMFPYYQENYGASPRKLAFFHFHFAKLYLYSHTFRGLGNAPIPPQLSEAAHNAVAAATTILDMIVSDVDVQGGLRGLPSYVQSMICFACVFLARLASVHNGTLVELGHVIGLISRVKEFYKTVSVGKWHLVHLLPNGFDKILAMLQKPPETCLPASRGGVTSHLSQGSTEQTLDHGSLDVLQTSMTDLDPSFLLGMGVGLTDSQHLYLGNDNGDFLDYHPPYA